MNKLWVFGCSFSTSFNLEHVEGYKEMAWPNLLANKLGFELKNYGHPGQCNWVNILHFIDYRDEISENDIIIFEFTFFDRYNIYPTRANLINLKDFFISHKMRMDDVYKNFMDVNFKWFNKQIVDYCKKRNLKIFFWSAEGTDNSEFDRYFKLVSFMPAPNDNEDKKTFAIYNKWQNLMNEQHINMPNGDKDKHFNKLGHERLAEHFEYCIKNNITYGANFI